MTLSELRAVMSDGKILIRDEKHSCSAELTNFMVGTGMGALKVLSFEPRCLYTGNGFVADKGFIEVILDIPGKILNEWIKYSIDYYDSKGVETIQ